MIKLSNSKIISIVSTLLALLLIAKLISLSLWWYLPTEGVELNVKKSYQAKYQRVDFKNMLIKSTAPVVEKVEKKASIATSINNLVLKGLYGNKINGYAILAKKASLKKTTIVGIGEVYEGYKLQEIELKRVIFTKNSKEYVLELGEKSKASSKSSISRVKKSNVDAPSHEVSKKDINYYSKNPAQIWKEIAISEVKKNGKIDGFRVNRIKKNSKMAELGLKKGDVIIKANNIVLKSYKDAIKLYQNIKNIDAIELVIIRDNQEKEIIYEIN